MEEQTTGGFDFPLIWQRLQEVLAEPAADLQATFVLVAIGALFLAALLVITIIVIVSRTREDETGADVETAEADTTDSGEPSTDVVTAEQGAAPRTLTGRGRRRLAIEMSLITAIMLSAIAAAGYVYTGSEGFCTAQCHDITTQPMAARADDPHSEVSCVRCHEESRGLQRAADFVLRVGHLAENFTQTSDDASAFGRPVPATRCLACHRTITEGVLVVDDLGVRMSHAEPLASGADCTDCHTNPGHSVGVQAIGMAVCLRCHDNSTASATCDTCHIGDTSAAVRTSARQRVFGKTAMTGPIDCGGCHDQTSCDSCHGLRLPHSTEFISSTHAREAAFERKELCWRCHVESSDCGRCHQRFEGAHPADWKRQHATFSPNSPCACHTLPNDPTRPFCVVCHP